MAPQSLPSGETVPPHGGRLVDLLVRGSEAEAPSRRASALPTVRLSARALSDLELLAVGGYSPLEGFMTGADYSVWEATILRPSDCPFCGDFMRKLRAGGSPPKGKSPSPSGAALSPPAR